MWNNFKEAMKGFWSLLTISMGVLFMGLLYALRRKQEQLATLKAKDKLNAADKRSTLLDKDIEQKQKENSSSQNKINQLEDELEASRKEKEVVKKKEESRPADQVEEYWKNN